MRASGGAGGLPEGLGTIRLTLVHGTFNPQAKWVTSDAEGGFRERLRKALEQEVRGYDIRFDAKRWKGRNSWKSRFDGARQLREHLDTSGCKGDERFVIAHSHGGNVALYALKDAPPESVRGVACLATPFLSSKPRLLAPFPMSAPVLLLALLVLLAFVGDLGVAWRWPSVGLLALYLTLIVPILRRRWRVKTEQERKKLGETGETPHLDEIQERRSLGSPAFPVLNVRTRNDEAEAALGWSQRMALKLSKLWSGLDRAMGWLVALGVLSLWFGRLAGSEVGARLFDHLGWTAAWEYLDAWLNAWMDPVWAVALTLAVLAFLLLLLCRMFFGFDGARWIACVETSVERTLPGIAAPPVELSERPGLEHALYAHPEAPPVIAAWIRDVLLEPQSRG